MYYGYSDNEVSWSKLGSAAESVPLNKPTVVLNFDQYQNDFDIQATIVHQFGHMLGLGHMHHGPQYWSIIAEFIDEPKMLKDLNISKKQFQTQIYSDYDKDSIMHYQ